MRKADNFFDTPAFLHLVAAILHLLFYGNRFDFYLGVMRNEPQIQQTFAIRRQQPARSWLELS